MHETLRRTCSLLMCVIYLVSQTGCSFLAGSKQRFSVNASEPDAQIFINGALVGAGQVQTMVKKNQSVSVMVKKDGYYPASREIDTTFSQVGVLDMIGGCIFLLPFFGLMAPGAKELDQSNVSVILQKEKQEEKETKNNL